MTTINEKLLAKAAEYEEKARALRFAAAEMNGDAVESKRKTALSVLDAAIALRNGQRNGHASANGNGQPSANGRGYQRGKGTTGRTNVPAGERAETVRGFLLTNAGPQPVAAIAAALAAAGQGISHSWINKLLRSMKDVRSVGRGNQTRWELGKGRAKAPKAKRSGTRADVRAKRLRIAEVLKAYDTKKPKAPIDIAKSFGLTVAQSGLAPLVNMGYLKKLKGGYIRTKKVYVVNEAAEPAASS